MDKRTQGGAPAVAGAATREAQAEAKVPKWKVWQDSPTVNAVKQRSDRPLVHIIVTPYMALMTADDFCKAGMRYGDLLSYAEGEMGKILKEVLPELSLADAVLQGEVCVDNVKSRALPSALVLIGHRSLFGPSGLIREVSESLIKTDILIAEARAEWRRRLEEREAND